MDAVGPQQFWSRFARDPRVPENQALRASDADRDQLNDAVSDAYADGRLTSTEMDERISAVGDARTLGELVPLVSDLMPIRDPTPRQAMAWASHEEIERQALERYEAKRRAAFASMIPALICLVIWIVSMVNRGGFVFPWPIFVFLASGGYLSTVLNGKQSALEEERRKLRKKQLKAREDERLGLPTIAENADDQSPGDR